MCEGVFVCDVLCVCVCVHLVGGFLCLCEYKCVCVYIGKGGRGEGTLGRMAVVQLGQTPASNHHYQGCPIQKHNAAKSRSALGENCAMEVESAGLQREVFDLPKGLLTLSTPSPPFSPLIILPPT